LSFDFNTAEDESGMLQSSRLLNELISAEIDSDIDAGRIVLGGFSQGGAMSLLTGLTSERKLGGIAVLSGWLPLHKKFKSVRKLTLCSSDGTDTAQFQMTSQHAKSLPIFWGHGSGDPLVRYELCTKSVEYLKTTCGIPELGAGDESINGMRCKVYRGMAHTSCPEELNDLKVWLRAVIPVDGGSKLK
jgi:lysophospholipase-1